MAAAALVACSSGPDTTSTLEPPSITPTDAPTDTPVPSPVGTSVPTATALPTPSPTDTSVPTATALPTPSPTDTPTPVPPGEKFVAISSGGYHTCALRANGEPVCWGAAPGEPSPVIGSVAFGQASPPEGERFTSISSGMFHTCGLREDGTPVCWGAEEGDSTGGRGGYSLIGFDQSSPPEGEVFVSINSGGFHTCGLREDGSVICWGVEVEEHSYLGVGQTSPPESERFVSISSGWNHSCGLREDGTAVCWGPEPSSGSFGGWDETPEEPFAWIDAAGGYTCGQHLGGGVECWGGWSDVVILPSPYPGWSNRFADFSAAGGHSCGLWSNGTAVCWGILNDVPMKGTWMGERQFTAISSGSDHTCAIELDGDAIVCWGNDDYGQSSPPGGMHLDGPEAITEQLSRSDGPLTAISSGGSHACGLAKDETVRCWGTTSTAAHRRRQERSF